MKKYDYTNFNDNSRAIEVVNYDDSQYLTDEQIATHFSKDMTLQEMVDKANELGVILRDSDIEKIDPNKEGSVLNNPLNFPKDKEEDGSYLLEKTLVLVGLFTGILILIIAIRKK